jgi:hypothetical protein
MYKENLQKFAFWAVKGALMKIYGHIKVLLA